MTTPAATSGYSTRSSASTAGLLDPSLLQDLAEALDYLHRQVDEAESELERSREQSLAFEQDARRWQDEAARLRTEAEETRHSLDALRHDFEQSKAGSERQTEAVDRIASEMDEIRAARAHLESLAAEQQRALVVSLELLRRAQPEAPAPADLLAEKDRQIEELRQLVHAAGEEGTRVDAELAVARLEIEALNAELEVARASQPAEALTSADPLTSEVATRQIEALRAELEASRVSQQPDFDSVTRIQALEAELDAARVTHQATNDELVRQIEALRAELEATRSLVPIEAPVADPAEAEKLRADLEAAHAEVAELKAKLESTPPPLAPVAEGDAELERKLRDAEAEIALQTSEVENRGAIITALENALEEQTSALRGLEERFLVYAEQVQALQIQRVEMPNGAGGLAGKIGRLFSPSKRRD